MVAISPALRRKRRHRRNARSWPCRAVPSAPGQHRFAEATPLVVPMDRGPEPPAPEKLWREKCHLTRPKFFLPVATAHVGGIRKEKELHMNTIDSINASAPATRKAFAYRALTAAFLAGGFALAGLGVASGTAQAAPIPAPQGNLCFDSYGMMTWCGSDY